jgi:hypothetical protein
LIQVENGQAAPEYRLYTPPSPQHRIGADFGAQIRLVGYDIDVAAKPTIQATEPGTHLTLYWQAERRPAMSYTVFAQLLGPADKVYAQIDSIPHGGGYSTAWWLPGEVVVDRLTIPLPPEAPRDVPYRLIVGLYDPMTGDRLPVSGTINSAQLSLDYLELTRVEP